MRVLIVGAGGTIGSAVGRACEEAGHEVLEASRTGDFAVDMAHKDSIEKLYRVLGTLDAVICCAGQAAFAPLEKLTDEEIDFTIQNKLLGQVNLVRLGIDSLADGGVFILTSGIFSRKPVPGVPAVAMANGALESFVRGAALDLPRELRINIVSPPFITETAEAMGMSAEGTVSAAENATAYLALLEGAETGTVVYSGGAG